MVFGIIGYLLMRAALKHDPSEAGGLADALHALERQPYAPYLLGGSGVGSRGVRRLPTGEGTIRRDRNRVGVPQR